ncbi:MAG: mannose-6-phosphate isomerase, class I [Thermodesulfobacteriota bacterium]|nr:mannose-6-phosphate isomerase, class I [Thermodesulfobacteriota bacterium]
MKTICLLENTIQEYEWGSYTAIASLLSKKASSDVPQAEIWMGAHPKASSMVTYQGKSISLLELISQYPEDILGKNIAKEYNHQLPFLFKVLAAAKPLSIQAHPSHLQAREGFKRENELNISKDSPKRNYKDDNHKPECICALTDFLALNGFRKTCDMLSFMKKVCSNSLGKELNELEKKQDADGLKQFFKSFMTLDEKRKNRVLNETLYNAKKIAKSDPAFEWMVKLAKEYPQDIGILSPAMLNLVCLKPGEAMFLFSGELHAYLDGLGIELMANSDNVLRGGLTSKHVDIPELLKVVNFAERDIEILQCEKNNTAECTYASMAKEFMLSVISVDSTKNFTSQAVKSAEILLCTDGQATITDSGNNETIYLKKGKSIIVPASVSMYHITGKAVIYKASVNSAYSS